MWLSCCFFFKRQEDAFQTEEVIPHFLNSLHACAICIPILLPHGEHPVCEGLVNLSTASPPLLLAACLFHKSYAAKYLKQKK